MDNLFETAARKKFRFPFKGQITTEDLWDLTPAQLDGVYKALNRMARAQGEESLMDDRAVDADLRDQIAIVKHIFEKKKEEKEAARAAAENKAKRDRILEVLAAKQDEALKNMSEEELQKMLSEME